MKAHYMKTTLPACVSQAQLLHSWRSQRRAAMSRSSLTQDVFRAPEPAELKYSMVRLWKPTPRLTLPFTVVAE